MKKILVMLMLLLVVASLVSCGTVEDYDDGFQNGYEMGYDEASLKYEDKYSDGYNEGYNEGYDDGCEDTQEDLETRFWAAMEDAKYMARSKTGWTVYEAWNSLGLYEEDPSCLTKKEYQECVRTLVLFCSQLEQTNIID